MEGDIVMSGNIGEIVQGGIIEKPRARGGIKNRYYLWQNGVLPYVIDSSFGTSDSMPELLTKVGRSTWMNANANVQHLQNLGNAVRA